MNLEPRNFNVKMITEPIPPSLEMDPKLLNSDSYDTSFWDNILKDENKANLTKTSMFTKIDKMDTCNSCYLPIKSVRALAKSIEWNSKITTLDLSEFELDNIGLQYLCLALESNLNIHTLKLGSNFGDHSAIYLYEMLKINTRILVLTLGKGNEISSYYMKIINLMTFLNSHKARYSNLRHYITSTFLLDVLDKDQITLDIISLVQKSKDSTILAEQLIENIASGIYEKRDQRTYKTVKVMVCGWGAVGKSQLIQALHGGPFDKSIPATDGVDFISYIATNELQQICRFVFYVTAGQDDYLITNRVFYSDECIVLVVWNMQSGTSPQNIDFDYWLTLVHFTAPKARIIVVGTRADEIRSSFPEKYFKLYPQLEKQVHQVSCLSRLGISALMKHLQKVASELTVYSQLLSEDHFKLHHWLSKKKHISPFMLVDELKNLKKFSDKFNLADALNYFSNIGLCLIHKNNLILNIPTLNLVFTSICSGVADKKGYIFYRNSTGKWNNLQTRWSYITENYVETLLVSFGLIVSVNNNMQAFVVPSQYPFEETCEFKKLKETQKFIWRRRYRFTACDIQQKKVTHLNYVPTGMLAFLWTIPQITKCIDFSLVSRKVLALNFNIGIVYITISNNQSIDIYVESRLSLHDGTFILDIVDNALNQVLQTYPNLCDFIECYVPCGCEENGLFNIKVLKSLLKTNTLCNSCGEQKSVVELIRDVIKN